MNDQKLCTFNRLYEHLIEKQIVEMPSEPQGATVV